MPNAEELQSIDLEQLLGQVIKKNRRSLGQNAMMWAILGDISDQVEWHGERLSKRDWKWVFTAAIRKQRMVPGIEGDMVYLGEPTSGMSKKEMSDMIDLMLSFGVDHGVVWSDQPE
ncbi:recombination protein NinB [bacterium]|nr:recombination protein NinB [bacterium]